MTSVAAVVVTFNRKVLLVECLRALLAQTMPVARILLVDNASSDGTAELLQAEGLLDEPTLRYLRLEANGGGAGGFHAGMKAAYEEGHDWLWLMDDDAEPHPEALARLSAHFDRTDVSALAPMVTDAAWADEFSEPHRAMRVDGAFTGVVRPVQPEDVAGRATAEITHCSFVGPCFPRRTVDAIGLPIADFFIHYDDYEYVQRARRLGPVLLVTDAKIAHKEARATNRLERKSFLGWSAERPRFESLWLLYFGYRNLMWLSNKEGSRLQRARLLLRHARRLAEVVAFDDHKRARLRFWNAALADGLAGRFDNAKPKRVLGR